MKLFIKLLLYPRITNSTINHEYFRILIRTIKTIMFDCTWTRMKDYMTLLQNQSYWGKPGFLKSSIKTRNNQLDSEELGHLEYVIEPTLNINYWIN